MSRVPVAESVLRWALRRSARTEQDMESRFPKFRQWLSGEAQPTLAQLKAFAKATWIPFGFLFLDKPPAENSPISCFRTIGDREPCQPSANLLDTIYIMQRRQWWMRDHLIEQGHEPLPFVGSETIRTDPKVTAGRMREALGLESQWAKEFPTWETAMRELRASMERAGILVFANGIVGNSTRRKLDINEFRGFVLVDEYAPLVFVNNSDAKAAQMFTLAHELAHIFYGSSAAFELREMQAAEDTTEQACNLAAAEFLVPEKIFRHIWNTVKDEPNPFQSVARYFKVSELVGMRRALDLQLIRGPEFRQFYRKYINDERRNTSNRGGGTFYGNQNLRLSHTFTASVIREVKSDRMSYIEAYRLTQLYGNTFEKYASQFQLDGNE